MSQINVNEYLNSSQRSLIKTYQDKWEPIALLTEPINMRQARSDLEKIYELLGLAKPMVYFVESPLSALNKLNIHNIDNRSIDIEHHLIQNLKKQLRSNLWNELQIKLYNSLHRKLWNSVGKRIYRLLEPEFELEDYLELESRSQELSESQYFNPVSDCIPIDDLVTTASLLDFCYSVLNCYGDEQLWQAYQSLVMNCGWLWTYERFCIVCERPRFLSLDDQNRFHGEGQPALQFNDNLSIYAFHGLVVPEKYAMTVPSQWQAQWLLEENNAELRRILMQGLGYSKICQELRAKKLDTWQEYTLLRIISLNFEPVHLLAMTCPSTNHTHILRVPPDIRKARKAICWINWGIDPTSFAIQT
ncbi:hypothetical protein H6G76_34785 [Nostoc sp. FACHB-152]|uniref:DUF6745 domain-containing protein n=1 Tax=Nostoc sp. FACHB-152 TaxID=2692837 RepID=UPI0016827DE9|nr:hypothetical protein [Nostoc sp. FACHB-152]MBD2452182.1 hypothetical protein [Nostoc sp. FACHB-152]